MRKQKSAGTLGKNIAIIGAGAAGFFGAIQCKRTDPSATVTIFERSSKILSKVRISGGGRCNVTHACFDNGLLVKNYPRGEKELRSSFNRFGCADTVKWFGERGVELKTEADGRMFPVSDSSQTIIDCLTGEAEKYGVRLKTLAGVESLVPHENEKIRLDFEGGFSGIFDGVLIAAGGFPSRSGYSWLKDTQHTIVDPVPSLFTFNFADKKISELMGISVENATVKIEGTKLSGSGPLLITHWGISGPCVLKLSSAGARILSSMNYNFFTGINWTGRSESELREELLNAREKFPRRTMLNQEIHLPKRLWEFLLKKCNVKTETAAGQLPKEQLNRLIAVLSNDRYEVKGKTTFKEEFVTSGGIDLGEIDFKTMQSRKVRNLFFAGEVLNVDAVTGGFNFQAAWTTGYIAGSSMGIK